MSFISTSNNFKQFPNLAALSSRSPSPIAYPPETAAQSSSENTPYSLTNRLLHLKKNDNTNDNTIEQLPQFNTHERQLLQAKIAQKWRPLYYKGEKSFSLQGLIAELRKQRVLVTRASLTGEGIFCWSGFSYFSNICTYYKADLPQLTQNQLQDIYYQFQSEAQSPCFRIDSITSPAEAVRVLELYGAQVKEKEGSFSCWIVSGSDRLLLKIRTPQTLDIKEYTPVLHVWSLTNQDTFVFEKKDGIPNPLLIFKRQLNPLFLNRFPLEECKNVVRLCKELCHGYQIHNRFDASITKKQETAIRIAYQKAQFKGNGSPAQGWLDVLDSVMFENGLEYLFTAYHLCLFLRNIWKNEDSENFWKLMREHKGLKFLKKEEGTLGAFIWLGLVQLRIPFEQLHSWLLLHGLFSAHCHKTPDVKKHPVCAIGFNNGTINQHFVCSSHVSKLHLQIPLENIWNHFNRIKNWIKGPISQAITTHLAKLFPILLHEIRFLPVADMPLSQEEAHLGIPVQFLKAFSKSLMESPAAIGRISGSLFMALSMTLETLRFEDFFPTITLLLQSNTCPSELEHYFQLALRSLPIRDNLIDAAIHKYVLCPEPSTFNQLMGEIQAIDPASALKLYLHSVPDLSSPQVKAVVLTFGPRWVLLSDPNSSLPLQIRFLKLCLTLNVCTTALGIACIKFLSLNRNADALLCLQFTPYISQIVAFLNQADRKLFKSFFISPFSELPVFNFLLKLDPLMSLTFLSKTTKELDSKRQSIEEIAKTYAKGQNFNALLKFLSCHLPGLEEKHLLRYFCTYLVEELIFQSKEIEARKFIEALPEYLPRILIKLVDELSIDSYLNEAQKSLERLPQDCNAEIMEKKGKKSILFRWIQLEEAREQREVQRLVFDIVSRRKELPTLDGHAIFRSAYPHYSSSEWLINKALGFLSHAVTVRDFEPLKALLNNTHWQKVTKRYHALVLKELLNLYFAFRKKDRNTTLTSLSISSCLEEVILFNASRMKKFEWERASAHDFALFLKQLDSSANFPQSLLVSVLERADHFLSLLSSTRAEALVDLLSLCAKNCTREALVESWIVFASLRLEWIQKLDGKQRVPLRDSLLLECRHYLNLSKESATQEIPNVGIINILMATLFSVSPSHAVTWLDAALLEFPQLAKKTKAIYRLGFKRALKNHAPLVAWEFLKKIIDPTPPPFKLIRRLFESLFQTGAGEIILHLLQRDGLVPSTHFATLLCDYVEKFLFIPPEVIASKKKRQRLLAEALNLVSKYPKETIAIFKQLIQQDLHTTHVETVLEIWENHPDLYQNNDLHAILESILIRHAPLALKYLRCPVAFSTLFGLPLNDAGAVFSRLFQAIVQLAHEDAPFTQRTSLLQIFQIREGLIKTVPPEWSFETIDYAILQACRLPKCTLTLSELSNCIVELFRWQTLNTHKIELQRLNLQFLSKMQRLKLELTDLYKKLLILITAESPPETPSELVELIDLSSHFSPMCVVPLLNQFSALFDKTPHLITQNENIFNNRLPEVFQRLLASDSCTPTVVLSLLSTYQFGPLQTLMKKDAHLKCYCLALYAIINSLLSRDYKSIRPLLLNYIGLLLRLLSQKRNITPMSDQLVLALVKKEIQTMRFVNTRQYCNENKMLIFSFLNLNNPQTFLNNQDVNFILFDKGRVRLLTDLITVFLDESYEDDAENIDSGVREFFASKIGILLEIVLKNVDFANNDYLTEHTKQIDNYFSLLTQFKSLDSGTRQKGLSILTTWSQRYFPHIANVDVLDVLENLVNDYSRMCELSSEEDSESPNRTEWILNSLLYFVFSKKSQDYLRLLEFMTKENQSLFTEFPNNYKVLFSSCIKQFYSESISWLVKNDVIAKLLNSIEFSQISPKNSLQASFFEMHLKVAGLLKNVYRNQFKEKKLNLKEQGPQLAFFLPLIRTYRESLIELYRNNERIFIDNPEFSINLADEIMSVACAEDYDPLVTHAPYKDVFSSQLFYHLLVNQKSSSLSIPQTELRLKATTKWVLHMKDFHLEMIEQCYRNRISLPKKIADISLTFARFAGRLDDSELFYSEAQKLKPKNTGGFHKK